MSTRLVWVVIACLFATSCGTSAAGGGGSGGATGAGGHASGGSTGGGGSGGGAPGTGGTTGSGGSVGTGGVAASGGRSGGGGTSSGGHGGSGASGGGAGGAGSGGTTGSGGATGGSGGTASAGGTSGAAGSACAPSCANKTCGNDGCNGTCGGCPSTQMCSANGVCQTPSGSGVSVDTTVQLTTISPDIYGVAFATDSSDDSSKLAALDRWGGDAEESYNWQKDMNNSGGDWNCANYAGGGSGADTFVQTNKSNGLDSLMTIPITGWLANVATSSESTSRSALGPALSVCNYPQLPDGGFSPRGPVARRSAPRNPSWWTRDRAISIPPSCRIG